MDYITVYNYSMTDGRYLGEDVAYQSPVNAGEYLIPRGATRNPPPPANDGMSPVYLDVDGAPPEVEDDGAWALIQTSKVGSSEEAIIDTEDVNKQYMDEEVRKCLCDADVLINIFEDNDIDVKNIRKYRQSLRDLSREKGYPDNVQIPVLNLTPEQVEYLNKRY
jgi:hypothetical protein